MMGWCNMCKQSILIVEDERKLSRVLQLELEYENYTTEIAENGKEALGCMQEGDWDLVLLDIMIQERRGLEVLRGIRRTFERTPIILLTTRNQALAKVTVLVLDVTNY